MRLGRRSRNRAASTSRGPRTPKLECPACPEPIHENRSHQDRGPSDVLAGLRTLTLLSFKDSRLVMTTLDAMLYIA